MKQSQINASNILNNVKVTNLDSVLETINVNFNKGLIDELTAEQAFEQIEILEKAIGHKYFKREGSPGNYKYYYTAEEYRKAKGKRTESKESKSSDTKGEPKAPSGKLKFLQSVGSGLNKQRYWEDEVGNVWRDPHPNIERTPGERLIFSDYPLGKREDGDESKKRK